MIASNDLLSSASLLALLRAVAYCGDSYMAGAYGVVLSSLTATAIGRAGVVLAVGGNTLLAQVQAAEARPLLRQHIGVLWDGSNNGYVDQATDLALYRRWTACFDRYIIIPSGMLGAGPYPQAIADRDALIAQEGAEHVLDWRPVLAAVGDGSTLDNTCIANGTIPDSLRLPVETDPLRIHLGATAMTAMAAAIAAKITALGY